MEIFLLILVGVVLFAVNEYQKGQVEQKRWKLANQLIKENSDRIEGTVKENFDEAAIFREDNGKKEVLFAIPFKPVFESWHNPSDYRAIQRRCRIIWERLPESNYVDLRGELFQLLHNHWVIVGTSEKKQNFSSLYDIRDYHVEREVELLIGRMRGQANEEFEISEED